MCIKMKTFETLTKNLEHLIKIIKELKGIEKDCLKMKKTGHLTDYGEGQLDLIHIMQKRK